jgi:hypothetical protein
LDFDTAHAEQLLDILPFTAFGTCGAPTASAPHFARRRLQTQLDFLAHIHSPQSWRNSRRGVSGPVLSMGGRISPSRSPRFFSGGEPCCSTGDQCTVELKPRRVFSQSQG